MRNETVGQQNTNNRAVLGWVDQMAKICQPDQVFWCDGSETEKQALTARAVAQGVLLELNQKKLPGCYYHRSHPNDVARVEQFTFVCTELEEEAGPTNNWAPPGEMYRKLYALCQGAMRGRTLYVIPYLMGPPGSPLGKVGIELTDSIYVALSMRIMTRMGDIAYQQLGESDDFNRGLHTMLDLDPERRYIAQFPQDNAIISVGSNYGGNVLLGKKCLALRIGSYLGRKEGWLAEHMLILGVESPAGEKTYVAAAFPSACGKTNFAMMIPPPHFQGWKIWTIGDDIAWMKPGLDGRLYAINPEFGYFGVAPGTNVESNSNAVQSIARDTIYTNVALTPDLDVWWEGKSAEPPPGTLDWKGHPWVPGERAAHPNSRFTAPLTNNPMLAPEFDDPRGVPISAIIFGGRRATTLPLLYEAFNWVHGVYLGATMGSETTAAAAGQVGQVRRDPMAMLPFVVKERYLKPLLDGRTRSAFGMTEIEVASSDATNIETDIRRDGDEYVINGRKWFTHNVPDPRCDLIIVMGKTDANNPDRHKQQSMIIVPFPHPGVIYKRMLPIMGFDDAPHGYPEVVFDNVRVPVDNMLLGEGRGFEIAQGRLGPGRIHHCMRLVGLAERALERMCRRLASREAFGAAVSTQSVWKERIAESRILIEQARLLTLKAAWMMDTVGNKGAKQEIAMIKVMAPNMACKVIDWAMQAFGGAGMTDDYGLPLAYTWARLLRIADGPDEVHRNQIARLEFKKYDGPVSENGGSAHIRPRDTTPTFDARPRWIS